MKIVYAGELLPPPEIYELDEVETAHICWRSIFLAGPTPRSSDVKSWRGEAIAILNDLEFDGHVFVPETADGGWLGDHTAQVRWEWAALSLASKTVFWVDRELTHMPGFTTNVEFGFMMALRADRVILGCPDDAPKTRYLKSLANDYRTFAGEFMISLETIPVAGSLKSALEIAVNHC